MSCRRRLTGSLLALMAVLCVLVLYRNPPLIVSLLLSRRSIPDQGAPVFPPPVRAVPGIQRCDSNVPLSCPTLLNPAQALQIALDDDAAAPELPDVLTDEDAERCIWNNRRLIRCASQWTRGALRELAREFKLEKTLLPSLPPADAECTEYLRGGSLRRFLRNENGITGRYQFEFLGDSNSRALFHDFVRSFNESALQQSKKRVDFYVYRGPLFPPSILLPRYNIHRGSNNNTREDSSASSSSSSSSSPSSQKWRRGKRTRAVVPESDIVRERISKRIRCTVPLDSHTYHLYDSTLYYDDSDPIVSQRSGAVFINVSSEVSSSPLIAGSGQEPAFVRALNSARKMPQHHQKHLRRRPSFQSSVLRAYVRYDTDAQALSAPRFQRGGVMEVNSYDKLQHFVYRTRNGEQLKSAIPSAMWRREILRSAFSALSLPAGFRVADVFTFADVVTNSDTPKIIINTNVHLDAFGFLRRPSSAGSARFNFTDVYEEERTIEVLDALWRYFLQLSTRRNVHMYVHLGMLYECEHPATLLCVAAWLRQHQTNRLQKLLRFEIMRAAGLLNRTSSALSARSRYHLFDDSLSPDESRQRKYFVDTVEEEVLAPMRRRKINVSSSPSSLTFDEIADDVHFAARRYIREELLSNMKSPTALHMLAKLMARTVFIESLDTSVFAQQCAGRKCSAYRDQAHLNNKYNLLAVEAVLAALGHLDECDGASEGN